MYNAVYQTAEVFENICPEYVEKKPQTIVENGTEHIFYIYPIPNKGSFYLRGKISCGYSVNILNMMGSEVHEMIINEDTPQQLIQTHLSSGSYIVVVNNSKGEEVFRENIVVIL